MMTCMYHSATIDATECTTKPTAVVKANESSFSTAELTTIKMSLSTANKTTIKTPISTTFHMSVCPAIATSYQRHKTYITA